MHNGSVAEWPSIKRNLQNGLPDVAFNMVQGNTGPLLSRNTHKVIHIKDHLSRLGMGICTISFQSIINHTLCFRLSLTQDSLAPRSKRQLLHIGRTQTGYAGYYRHSE